MGNQTGVARPGSSRGVGERGDGFLNTWGRTSAPCPEQLPGWRCSNEPLRKEGAGRRGPGARLGPGLGFALLSPWCPVVPRGRRRGSVQTALRVAVGESGPHPAPPTPAASPQAWQPLGVTLRARARGVGGGWSLEFTPTDLQLPGLASETRPRSGGFVHSGSSR